MCDIGSLSEIFENHHEGGGNADQHVRNGTGFRLQCEGNLWVEGLNRWLSDEKTKLKKKMQAERKMEGKTGKGKLARVKEAELVLPDRIEQKLKMGLSLLMALAEALHVGVLKINPELAAR